MGSQQNDPILSSFLEAEEGAEGEPLQRLFAELVGPTVKRALAHKFRLHNSGTGGGGDQDSQEIYHEVQLNLLKRLRELKADPAKSPIGNFKSYIATATNNAYDEHLRRSHPRRRSLKDKLRYHIANDPSLALWQELGAGLVAGLEEWGADGQRGAARLNPQSTQELIRRARELLQPAAPESAKFPDLVWAIFRAAGSPVRLDDLVSIVAGLLHIQDRPLETADEGGDWIADQLPGPRTDPESIAERHQLLQWMWGEICRLPRNHRIALLFNLRGEGSVNVVTLLPLTGVATFDQIASALEIPAPQLEVIWPELPMDDLSIADFLGLTRQQVINMRKNARARLYKLMEALEAGPGRG